VRLLDAVHDLERRHVEFFLAADAAEHGMHDAGGAMGIETQLHQPVNYLLNLRLGSALLHDYEHGLSVFPSLAVSMRIRCSARISSMMRSKMRCAASGAMGPLLCSAILRRTSSSRFGSYIGSLHSRLMRPISSTTRVLS